MTTEPLNADLVRTFVAVAHGDLAQVQSLLAQEPQLVNACWDWGGGDWETALGAAAHTGSRAIAEHLLVHGARLDVFAAAMLGKQALVQAFLDDDPQIAQLKGPHGIPLLQHALVGQQTAIAALLQAYGA